MYTPLINALAESETIVIIQPENPDGDSLGSAIALEHIFADLGKTPVLYCAIEMPKYLRYVQGWDRVTTEWTGRYDAAIIVDTTADTLLEMTLAVAGVRHFLESHPVVILDHHQSSATESGGNTLSFPHELILGSQSAATGELIYDIAKATDWKISPDAAEALFISIQSDTLGLTTESVTSHTYHVAAELVRHGAVPAAIESKRREYMKKPADILRYKGELLQRVEYHYDEKLALVHIPWEEIASYSDKYNPSVLVLDEMRFVETVEVAIALKTYPDGKVTGKIRANLPVAGDIAGYFGGGGHEYAAGFKVHEDYDTIVTELITAARQALEQYHATV